MSAAIDTASALEAFASLAQTSGRAYLRGLHPGGQREFVRARHQRRAAVTSRRAGKSHGIGCWLLDGAEERPGGSSCFIALTRNSARQIMWKALQQLNRRHELKLQFKTEDGQLYVVHPNEHTIWISGCPDRSEIEKYRGQAFDRVAVDEAQALAGYLGELVEDVLDPTLLDRQGQIALTGTPGPVCAGYFHCVTTGGGEYAPWPTYNWTVLHNSSIPHAGTWLEAKRLANRWELDNPTYRREWLGEWVNDSGALVYPFSRALNQWDGVLPEGEYSYALGVDIGFHPDPCAFVVLACRRGLGELYVLEAEKQTGLIPTAVAARVEGYKLRYPGIRVVVDEGALGKGYGAQMRAQGVGCEAADKSQKRAAQEWTRGEILSSALKVDYSRARVLVEECAVLAWDEGGAKEDERFQNHCGDAMLYGARALWPVYRPEENPPVDGSPEWFRAQQAKWKKAEIGRQLAKRQQARSLRDFLKR
jgi:hypothetical protein